MDAAVAVSDENYTYAATNMGLANNKNAANDTTIFTTYETKSNIVAGQLYVSGISVYAEKK